MVGCEEFGQKKGMGLEEIFSHLVRMSLAKVVLGLATTMNSKIKHLDMKTTFLHGDLEEENLHRIDRGVPC